MKDKEYMQLPAMRKDTDPDIVKAIWAYAQLPEKYKHLYEEQHELFLQKTAEADQQVRANIDEVQSQEIEEYEETMRSIIRDIVIESCNLARWVHHHKYGLHETVEEMIDQQPYAEKYIVAMNLLMDDADEKNNSFPQEKNNSIPS